MNLIYFDTITSQNSFLKDLKNFFITDNSRLNDSILFDTLIKNNQIEQAISIYSSHNHLIDLSHSVCLDARFCDIKNFQKFEQFSKNKLSIRKKELFYQNALNWAVATDCIENVSYLYNQKTLQAEWFNEDLFKIAIENNATKLTEFFILQVRIPFTENLKLFLEEKSPKTILQFESRIPFVFGDDSDFKQFLKNFKENNLFKVKKNKLSK